MLSGGTEAFAESLELMCYAENCALEVGELLVGDVFKASGYLELAVAFHERTGCYLHEVGFLFKRSASAAFGYVGWYGNDGALQLL